MPLETGDLQWRLSGGAANADPNASLGGVMSSTAWAGGVLHDLFDQVSDIENEASDVEFRCVYIRNGDAAITGTNARLWFSSQVVGGTDLAIGLDPAGVGDGSTTGVATTVADENTAPVGVTFSNPTTEAGALTVASLAPGEGFAFWIRRTAANTVAINNDGGELTLKIASPA